MKTSLHSRRLRNIHQHEEQQKEPFFSRSSEHERRPFFTTRQAWNVQAVQAQLKIGKPGDRYEQEADRVAGNVVARNGGSPEVQRQEPGFVQCITLMSPAEDEKLGTAEARMEKDKLIQEKIQRMGGQEEEEPLQMMGMEEEELQAKEEEEESLQMAELEEEEVQAKEEEEDKPIQRMGMEEEKFPRKEEDEVQAKQEEEEVQAKAEGGNVASPGVSQNIKKSAGGGRPLSGDIRVEMERVFGTDFSGVNIHTDADSIRLNRNLRSRAFTHGQDIFFNEGEYRPETSEGKRLLAHELAHVVQQAGPEGRR
jgi:hypothetical protein